MNWSKEQSNILDNCDRNLYIAAGPGSGKSTVLAEVAKRLLDDNKKLILLTFTNKAAKTITKKVNNKSNVIAGTFHGLCYKLLIDTGAEFNICDESKKRLIIKKLFNCKADQDKFKELYEEIKDAKSAWPMDATENVVKFNNELKRYNMLDFDDIIYSGIDLIGRLSQEYISAMGITHILVDELQDTSEVQLIMLQKLQEKFKCKMIGVGDEDQCLYEWRAARYENVQDFITLFKCDVSPLGVNFRSRKNIVERSRKLIEHNTNRISKDLRAHNQDSGIATTYSATDIHKELNYLVSKCKSNPGKTIAILYRNRLYKHYVECELKKNHLSYTITDATELYDRSTFRVAMAVIKIATKGFDHYDLEIASSALKKIGPSTVARIKQAMEGSNSFTASLISDPGLAKRLTEITALQTRFELLKDKPLTEFVDRMHESFISSFKIPDDIMSFLREVSKEYKTTEEDVMRLFNELGLDQKDEVQDDAALIELSTIHGFKGEEHDIVIMPFCHTYINFTKQNINIQEERRVFYVGVTRPKEKLFLSYSGMKPLFIREMDL